ncbi:hypothetical protein CEP48_08595 [Mergibacter septicus]|uniref:Uncharacterized protein n=1 Tax=Mergibacter septicus TaxID=221402 RepID=A0A8E3SDF3_9PAST|nr:DUF262 domain-containing protein [Mergibacter septicus]AWX16219.1 hypothetical protein CEP47_08590 [Mergibacter septicus]QDJ15471.1 hypothetical protein CEP48_08595 [Mergibacter septicus]UTU48659.1 DUF262 domain-containing protein [Mergibacter septicus]WMR95711.1 DUF262 domain-containing HNH endonuclease family protein [Mergibacter septicus]
MDTNKVKVISDLIEKNQRIFKIPVYQRNYDWREEQCRKLFNDIIQAYKNDRKHFLGILVYIKGSVDTSTLSEVLVVDGQQRLTTLYILLKVLLDCAENNKNESVYNEVKEYIYNRRCSEEFKIKLKPIQADNIQLKKLMENKFDEMLSTSNITRNYKFFNEIIKESDDLELRDILDGMKKLEMVEIILDKSSGDDAQIIFESINSTGLELTLADLIRNFLLMDDCNQDRLYQEYWLFIEDKIGHDEVEEFLIQYLNSRSTNKITRKNAYEKFKIYYNNNFDKHEAILEELKKYSKYYAAFIGKKSAYSDEINYLLNSFQVLEQTTIYSFLFRVFEDHENRNLSDYDLIRILTFLRSYSIRRIVCEIPSNSLRGFYNGLYDRIIKNIEGSFYVKLVQLISELNTKDRILDDEEFKSSLIYKDLYKKVACKYLLSEIENHTKEKIDLSNLNIEHILPQKENSIIWKKEIGGNYNEVYEKYLHTLGNLTITGHNSELGTKKFSEKKRIIKDNSKANILNKDIISADCWNEKVILDRANRLSDIIIELFNYEKVDLNYKSEKNDELVKINDNLSLRKTKPYKFVFLGEEISVKTYVELLDKFINLLYEIKPDLLRKLAKQEYMMTNSNSIYIGYEPSKIRKAREISNSGIFYESNLSSEYIMMFVKKLIVISGFDIEDFEFGIKIN